MPTRVRATLCRCLYVSTVACLNCLFLWNAAAQQQSAMQDHVSQPVQIPLSALTSQPGSVTSTQSTKNAGGGNSINIINSSVNVQGTYSGSVPTGLNTGSVLALTLEYALKLGLAIQPDSDQPTPNRSAGAGGEDQRSRPAAPSSRFSPG